MKPAPVLLLLALILGAALVAPPAVRALAPPPWAEFEEGRVEKFSTKGHAKSKGVTLTMEYPRSWKAAGSDRADVVQKLVSDAGNGGEHVLIVMTPLPAEAVGTPEKATALLSPESQKQFLPQGATFLRATTTTLANNELAGVLEYFTPNEDAKGKGNGAEKKKSEEKGKANAAKPDTHTVACLFVQGATLVQVQFRIVGTEYAPSEDRTGVFRRLWDMMMYHIVFP